MEVDNLTNFEAMKAKILQTIEAMDEEDLYEFIDNTNIDVWMEGIFNCSVCGDKYGDCTNCRGTKECERRYKDWCCAKKNSQSAIICIRKEKRQKVSMTVVQ